MKRFSWFTVFVIFAVTSVSVAQVNIPIGTWRTHYSFNQINNVIEVGNAIYATSQNGLFILDRDDNSITRLTKNDGLQGGEISAIAFDENSGLLLIGYASGNLDVIDGFEISNLDLTTNSQIQGSKSINHISVYNNFAYLSTDFGVLKFDLLNQEVKETYRELGLDGNGQPQALKVNMSAVFNDSLFIASAQGVLAANIVENINLLDYTNWKRFTQSEGIPEMEVNIISSETNRVIAGINQQGLFFYENDWVESGLLVNEDFKDISTMPRTLITTSNAIYELANTSVTQIGQQQSATTAIADADAEIWIGTTSNGLINLSTGESYSVDGPLTNNAFRLNFSNDKLLVAPGGFLSGFNPLNREGAVYMFEEGDWENQTFPSIQDVTECISFDNSTFCASFGSGLVEITDSGEQTVYNQSNSPLANNDITGLTVSNLGLWLLNNNQTQIFLLNQNREWQSVSAASGFVASAIDIIVAGDLLWLTVDPSSGGGIVVVDPFSGDARYLSTSVGNGGLANNTVNSLTLDKEGFVWAGTATGVSVFSNPFTVLSGNVDAVEPIFENRLLLQDEVITDIEVDGGNRKWIGTERGVWLFDEQADRQIRFFNSENSPLPSSSITDIEINDNTGEVFFATQSGIVSWRGTATKATNTHTDIEIFPNPVRENYNGTVGISGLASDANVKITDVSGKLIWQTQAEGGTAIWRVRDYNGNRAATGVYLVFSSTADGEDALVGKIAVVN